jgi:hypothetical protein
VLWCQPPPAAPHGIEHGKATTQIERCTAPRWHDVRTFARPLISQSSQTRHHGKAFVPWPRRAWISGGRVQGWLGSARIQTAPCARCARAGSSALAGQWEPPKYAISLGQQMRYKKASSWTPKVRAGPRPVRTNHAGHSRGRPDPPFYPLGVTNSTKVAHAPENPLMRERSTRIPMLTCTDLR